MNKNQSEHIICSAIRFIEEYNDLGTRIVCGRRHCDCYKTVKCLNETLFNLLTDKNTDQGFMTSKGRFVTRSEAYKIAKREEQFYLPDLSLGESTKILTSEDLFGFDY